MPPEAPPDPASHTPWTCERCGYDTGLVGALHCPECGFVRPRESVFERERRERDEVGRENTLRCLACEYELPWSPVERCPECGSADVFVQGDRPIVSRSSRLVRFGRWFAGFAKRLWRLVVGNSQPF